MKDIEAVLERKRISIAHILAHREVLPEYIVLKKEKVLPQLARALAKVRAGTYGTCDDCPDTISKRRLKAAPGATRCIVCQRQHEGNHKKRAARNV